MLYCCRNSIQATLKDLDFSSRSRCAGEFYRSHIVNVPRIKLSRATKKLSEKTILQNSLQSYQNNSTITTTNTMTNTATLENLLTRIEEFRAERNWQQFHSPKNLAMALSVECSELMEIFQWMTSAQSFEPDQATRSHIKEEIGDVMIYLSLLSSIFDIDPIDAALEKMKANEKKYPAPP